MPTTVTLERVRKEFSDWRTNRAHREAIPDRLWAQALKLSSEIGISSTCRELHLNHSIFKRYRDKVALESIENCPPHDFIEIPQVQSPPSPIQAEFTLDCHDGRRLNIRFDRAPIEVLSQFAKLLVSAP